MRNWCPHITRAGNNKGWVMLQDFTHATVIEVPRSWKVCPVCIAERPTKAAIKAAKLKFAMDNDN